MFLNLLPIKSSRFCRDHASTDLKNRKYFRNYFFQNTDLAKAPVLFCFDGLVHCHTAIVIGPRFRAAAGLFPTFRAVLVDNPVFTIPLTSQYIISEI